MKIMHVSPFKLGTQHGLYNAVWALAQAQVASGHEVFIIRAGKLPSSSDVQTAREVGVVLDGCPFHPWLRFWKDEGCFRQLLDRYEPDIVHLQYVRIPKYLAFSRVLSERKLPYVVSLHGGMSSAEMRRRGLLKLAYWSLVERKIHDNAAGFHFISQHEKEDYYMNYMRKRFADTVIPNPVVVPNTIPSWAGAIRVKSPRFVYFGRYDIWHKGLDLAAELLLVLQEEFHMEPELHLYGSPGTKHASEFANLRRKFSHVRIVDHGIVRGEAKYWEMAKYDFYIQYSRFEVFGMSIAEALSLGMPVILSENCDLADSLKKVDGAIVIPMNPKSAAALVARAMKNRAHIEAIRKRGQAWIRECCSPEVVAKRMEAFYRMILEGWR